MTSGGSWAWRTFFTEDPRDWISRSDDAAARWVLLTGVLDVPADDPRCRSARAAALVDPATADLVGRLTPWDQPLQVSGHDHPHFQPNLLHLLADRGVAAGDIPEVDGVLQQMLDHQEHGGRFPSLGLTDGTPAWGALLCDSHVVTEVLLRFGHGDDPRVVRALAAIRADLVPTSQGPAWPCLPHPVSGFRGPGRKGDFCPQVSLEALRAFSYVAEPDRPPELLVAARVSLAAWRNRATAKPYMFGHGRAFKTVKWPPTWYGAFGLLDALGRYPALWQGSGPDRRAMAELAACLVAYNLSSAGRVTPRSVRRGFEAHSFGQKQVPSALATARVLAVLHRLDELASEVARVDATSLASSKGGSGTALPPPGAW